MSNEIDQFIANNPNVSRETIAKLTDFQSFLTEQNSKHNLVSRSQLDKIWMRHIHDSLRIFYLVRFK
jgi:16S rRNA (guanine527-N7)-methyltransferase